MLWEIGGVMAALEDSNDFSGLCHINCFNKYSLFDPSSVTLSRSRFRPEKWSICVSFEAAGKGGTQARNRMDQGLLSENSSFDLANISHFRHPERTADLRGDHTPGGGESENVTRCRPARRMSFRAPLPHLLAGSAGNPYHMSVPRCMFLPASVLLRHRSFTRDTPKMLSEAGY
jgi:hypothetical protein